MLICARCIGNKRVKEGDIYIVCPECDERGYKNIGEDLSIIDKEIKRLLELDL